MFVTLEKIKATGRPPDFISKHGVVYFINPEDRPAATRNFVKTALQMFVNGELGNREDKKEIKEVS